MNKYEFCAQWILDQKPDRTARVLDYGCGAGQVVRELRNRNIAAFGCDIFYEGGDYPQSVDDELFAGGAIRRMVGNAIPFEHDSFDFVVSSQVMEHVEDLDGVLAEIRRVLRPGGMILSLFPDKGVWREGHCGVPFLHWFSRNSRTRVYYAAGFRLLGFGHHKKKKSVMRWSQDFCEWLDNWTHYRSREEITATYRRYFSDIWHIEDYWLQTRLGERKSFVGWVPASIQKLVVNKLGGLVFVARKPMELKKRASQT